MRTAGAVSRTAWPASRRNVVDGGIRPTGETYESLLPFEQQIDLDGVPVRTVNLEGLLKTKRTYREKDALDRSMIEEGLRRGQASGEPSA